MELPARKMNLSSSSSSSLLQLGNGSFFVVLSLIAALLSLNLAGMEARYLPTRADQSDLVVLKDLIRLVLEEQNLATRPTYYQHQQQQQPFQVQRRSPEVPNASDGDNLLGTVETRSGISSSVVAPFD